MPGLIPESDTVKDAPWPAVVTGPAAPPCWATLVGQCDKAWRSWCAASRSGRRARCPLCPRCRGHLAPLIAPYDPYKFNLNERGLPIRMQPPSATFPFGTDPLGRDVLSRIVYGSRVSLIVGFASVALGTLFGTLIGLASGYWEGKVDQTLQRAVDTTMAIPGIVLALAVVSVLGQSLTNIILVISLVIAPGASRVVRGTVLSVKQNAYIDAAYAAGASSWRIVGRHILPNVFAPILVIASVWLGNAIVIEAALSFLGLGTPPPTPTWGGMLSGEGRRNLETAPFLAIFPGLAISIVVLAFNMLGDALRDLLDPRLRSR